MHNKQQVIDFGWCCERLVRGQNKKEIKNLRFTVGDLIVHSRVNNMTVST